MIEPEVLITHQDILDLYTEYLLSSFGRTRTTGLSELLDAAVSHDRARRWLSSEVRRSKDLWRVVKALVREIKPDLRYAVLAGR